MSVGRLLGAGAGPSAPTLPIPAGQPASVSRRELLSGLVLLGIGAAAGTTTAVAVDGITTSPASLPTAGGQAARTSMTLRAPRVRIEAIGQQPGVLPRVDAPFAASGTLADASGVVLGTFTITPVPGAAAALQLHTFELEGGTLLGMGAATAGGGTFAIVGGTGRFRGATGTYTARLGTETTGRQASAEFQFDLTGE